jgi:acetyl-CoA/propionyl-CoA carboxylase biotin carboxyl carrier protein
MFDRILIANRGEIAVRIARTCHRLGIEVVAVHSDVDSAARHVAAADIAIHLPGVIPADTYLNLPAIVEAGRRTRAQAIHPGYGFLSERAEAAEGVAAAGLTWIGPPPAVIMAAGDKIQARRLAQSVGVDPVPGTLDPIRDSSEALAFGDANGYPVAVKAAGGGGGRGLKVAYAPDEVQPAFDSAVREATAYFGSGEVYLERYLPRPKHVEVQILSPDAGRAMWLGARDCSLQRRHQKLVEETPPPLFGEIVPVMGEAAVAVADACGYVNAGTVEFLVDEDGRFYFLEINARLQVEHTITEEVTGIDLVEAQLRISAGEGLGFGPQDLAPGGRVHPRGHAIECRINAEDPARGFLPGPGRIERYTEPVGPGVRVDSGFGSGDEVPRAYDSLIAKLLVWAPTREEARTGMLRALANFEITGVPTTIPAHEVLLANPEFVDGSYSTRTVEGGGLDSLRPAPGEVAGPTGRLRHPATLQSVRAGAGSGEGGAVVAPMHGTILRLLVSVGDRVKAGDPVAILEAMKMETSVAAGMPGTLVEMKVAAGDVVEAGAVVALVE